MTEDLNSRLASISPPDLGNLVREEVDRQLSTQRQVLNDAIGLATKIVGVAFAILIGIFTVFGLTTWKDIRIEAAELVKKQTEELLKGADAEMGVKTVLTTLLNRAVVASTLARSTRDERDKLAVSFADWTRLRAWITTDTLELQDFTDTLAVLNLQDEDRKTSDANRVLAKMLEANPESQFRWIRDQPDKIEAILSVFKHRDLAPKVIAVLKTGTYSEAIELKAAKYPSEVGFKEGADKLVEVYESLPWGKLKRTVLSSFLSLRPEHPGVVKAITTMLNEEPQADRLEAALDVLKVLWPASSNFDSSLDLSKVRELGPKLVEYLVKNGVRLELSSEQRYASSFILLRRDRFKPKIEAQMPGLLFWIPTAKTGAATGHRLTLEQFAALDPLWDVAARAANAGQLNYLLQLLAPVEQMSTLLDRIPQVEIGYFVVGDDAATIQVVRDSMQPEILRVGDLRGLYVLTNRKAGALQVSWTDPAGLPHTGLLKGIKGTKLRLRPERVPAPSRARDVTD